MAVATSEQIGTGIEGLDDILRGGLPHGRTYLVQGSPGVGKTTLALQFLREGAKRGERVLYVSMSETRDETLLVARSHGWSMDGIDILQLATFDVGAADDENTVFYPSEVELRETVERMVAEVSEKKPARVVIDSLSEIRLLSQTELQFRRQVMRLRHLFSHGDATVLLLDDVVKSSQLQSIAHGVIELQQLPQGYGNERRHLRVVKLRGLKFRGGYHDYKIETGGLTVFPRLVAAEHRQDERMDTVTTGNEELDLLLGGGVERGTSTLLLGPSGVGKSSVMLQLISAVATAGEPVHAFVFDENAGTLRARAAGLGISLDALRHVHFHQVDPAQLAPDELVHMIRQHVERSPTNRGMIVIDSLNGYVQAMPDENYLTVQMHELLTYLAHKGVMTVLVMSQHGMLGQMMTTPIDISYVADTVVLLRFFEARGRVHKAISVVKKRSTAHEDAIRELWIGKSGVRVGKPLTDFRGVLTGVPMFSGAQNDLLGTNT